MRRLIAIPLLLLALMGTAQEKRATVSARTELADKNTHNDGYDYGFNIGIGITYQMTIMYVEAEIYWFPGLNDIDYLHFQGTILGFNHHSYNERWRYSLGLLRPGFVLRGGGPHALFGSDVAIERYFNNGNFIGIKSGYDTKGDSKLWGSDSSHGVWYLSIKFGITL